MWLHHGLFLVRWWLLLLLHHGLLDLLLHHRWWLPSGIMGCWTCCCHLAHVIIQHHILLQFHLFVFLVETDTYKEQKANTTNDADNEAYWCWWGLMMILVIIIIIILWFLVRCNSTLRTNKVTVSACTVIACMSIIHCPPCPD